MTTTKLTTTTTTPVLMTEIPPGVGDEDEIRGDNGFETVTQIPGENEKAETTTKHGSLWTLPSSTENNSIVDENARSKSVETTEEPETEQERAAAKSGASWLSWSVAIIAIIVLLGLIAATTLFVIRYVRRSRRLHGKYNPAREENAVTSTYAMPMTTVSKQERLI
uniref:Uncharacterized protein n=1 Tax=Panagrolaimus sp. JU765 TaxID=591449 RepID=A0AC34R5H1_9BILA